MGRITVAVVIALLFHAFLFSLNLSRVKDVIIINSERPAVTITMSYKRPVESITVKKAPAINKIKEIEETPKKDNISTPVKVSETIIQPGREEKIIEESVPVEGGVITDTNSQATSDDQGEASSEAEETGASSEVIIEAEPLYRINPAPPYPKMARKRGYEGTVVLSVLVDKEGRAENLWVFESCGYNILDNAALEAVKEWLFEPGRQGDNPVDMWVQVPVRFEIK